METQEDTEANLRGEGIPFDVVLLEVDDGENEPRWRRAEDGTTHANLPPVEIVRWIGDNIRDFSGLDQRVREGGATALRRFGDCFFVIQSATLTDPRYTPWPSSSPVRRAMMCLWELSSTTSTACRSLPSIST